MKPEQRIRADLIRYLQARGWAAQILHGNQYQTGVPDLLIGHPGHGARLVDVKVPGRYSFTRSQRQKWPWFHQHGIGVWILTAATQVEYDKLFDKPNWLDYWKPRWGDPFDQPHPDPLIDELHNEYRRTREQTSPRE